MSLIQFLKEVFLGRPTIFGEEKKEKENIIKAYQHIDTGEIYESIERSIERIDEEAEKYPEDDDNLPSQGGSGVSENVVLCDNKPQALQLADIIKTVASRAEDDIKKRIIPRYPEDNKGCFNCDLKKDNDIKVAKKEAITDEEFHQEIDQYRDNKCQPDTCWGECQSQGWCDIATEYRERIHPRVPIQPPKGRSYVTAWKTKKEKKHKKYKRHKNKWK